MFKMIGCLFISLFVVPAYSAVPQKVAPTIKSNILVGKGTTFGGLAGSGFTLMDLRRTVDLKKNIERIVMDVADRNGEQLRGWPGYYFVELKNNPSKLVIDFAQMPNSRIDQKNISERFKKSLTVMNSSMSLDPLDSSLNLTLDLKKNTKVKVYQVAGKKSTSKVVIDLISE